jgi:hypothetical protein
MKQADLHIILFSAEPMQSIRSSARTLWKTYWQLLYVQILKSLTLCVALMLSDFYFIFFTHYLLSLFSPHIYLLHLNEGLFWE